MLKSCSYLPVDPKLLPGGLKFGDVAIGFQLFFTVLPERHGGTFPTGPTAEGLGLETAVFNGYAGCAANAGNQR